MTSTTWLVLGLTLVNTGLAAFLGWYLRGLRGFRRDLDAFFDEVMRKAERDSGPRK